MDLKNDTSPLPPLLYPAKDSAERAWMGRLKKQGLIRPIGPRLYASVSESQVSTVVRASWSTVIAQLFPNSLLSHRSALEYRPSPEGEIFLTSTTNREISYPGLTLSFMRGPGPIIDDPSFMTLRASSFPRALLENLTSRPGKRKSRILSAEDIERRLEEHLRIKGEGELNKIRERAREVANQLGMEREFRKLNGMISSLMRTNCSKGLSSAAGRARAAGTPYDPQCFERLQILFGELRHSPLPEVTEPSSEPDHARNKAFFDAYFSNYIEGTTFEIEEAEAIIFEGKVPENRPKDAHDVSGSFAISSNQDEMRKTPETFVDFEQLLKARHRTLMSARPEALPGQFKERPNRAGNTMFVHPELVFGTLLKGMDLYHDLPAGLARAIFMMFLVADVHPFTDGNGRIARIMMNAELVSAGLSTIIIPTVYREDYLLALRAMSRRHRARPLVDMLVRAQRFSTLEFASYPKVLKHLQTHNWFAEPDEAKILL